jgi:DNA polymerase elongation subunit (family B)
MIANGINKNLLSPKKIRNVDERRTASLVVKGRIFFDALKAYKYYQNRELVSYSQEFIMEEEGIDVPKVKFPYAIADLWNDEAPVKYEDLEPEVQAVISKEEFRPSHVIFARNVFDIIGLKGYMDKTKLIEFYDGIRKDIGCLFTDLLMANRVLDAALLRMCRNKIVLPTGVISGKGGGFKGGLVLEPTPGIYHNVFVVDFSRQYPSIIRGFNISPETILLPRQNETRKKFVRRMKRRNNVVLYDNLNTYGFNRRVRGVIPTLVDKFWSLRDYYTKLEYEARDAGNDDEADTWAIAVKRTKSTLNAIFGVMGYASFRLFKNECSAAITFAARLGSSKTIELLRERGFDIKYGDTDSVMFQDPLNRSVGEIAKIVEEVNVELQEWCKREFNVISPPLTLNTEAMYSDFIILSKKYYCGKYAWSSKKGYHTDYNWKGLATVRSDSSNVERTELKKILQMMLDRKPKLTILNHWLNVMQAVLDKKIPLISVGYPAQIKHRLENNVPVGYTARGLPTHIKAAIYSNQFLGTDWRTGDKPRRIPIDADLLTTFQKEFLIVRHDQKAHEYEVNGISTDEYYILPDEIQHAVNWMSISKRLRNKGEKLFEFMNIKLKDIPKDYYEPVKQVSLMSWLRG